MSHAPSTHSGQYAPCPICGATAHHCANGNLYCGEADATMTPEQVEQAVRAREMAQAIIAAGSYAAYKAAVHGQVTP